MVCNCNYYKKKEEKKGKIVKSNEEKIGDRIYTLKTTENLLN